MHTWLIVVIAVVVLALLFWGATHGLERRVEAGAHREQAELAGQQARAREVAARDELAKDAAVASFGLNLPWRRARRDSR